MNATVYNSCLLGNWDIVIFAVWKTISTGETVGVQTGGAHLVVNQTMNVYIPVFGLGPGTYFVSFFGILLSNDAPVSYELQILVTIR